MCNDIEMTQVNDHLTHPIGLFVFVDFKPKLGSMGEQGHQLMKHLTELGENIIALAPDMPGDEKFDAVCGYPVMRYSTRQFQSAEGSKTRFNRATLLRAVIGAVRKYKPDYLICNLWGPQTGISMVIASKLTNLPWFLVAHGEELKRPTRWPVIRRRTVQDARRVICVSRYTQCLVETLGVSPDRVDVVLNGFDYEQVSEHRRRRTHQLPRIEDAFAEGGPTVLTVCRLRDYKGVDRMIKAMPTILSAVPDAKYLIGGDGVYREELESLARISPARDRITFLGDITEREKFECYERCQVFAMPSRPWDGGQSEGFGLGFAEANAFGKAVVGGRVGGTATDAIIDGETGILVDPNDVEEIASAVIRLLSDKEESARLGENGRRRVESELNWKTSAIKLRPIIHSDLESRE